MCCPGAAETSRCRSTTSCKETGCHVNFIGASGNSENLAKIKLGGGDQYDIVGVDALWVPKFYQEGVIEVFDFEKMPEYEDLFDEFKKMTVWKVGNQWMAQPWAWSPLVLWYNADQIKTPPTSINFLFDPALKQRIALTRQQEDVVAWMGIAVGAKNPYAMTDAGARQGQGSAEAAHAQRPEVPAAGGRAGPACRRWKHLGYGAERRRRDPHQGRRRSDHERLHPARGRDRLFRRRLHRQGRKAPRRCARLARPSRAREIHPSQRRESTNGRSPTTARSKFSRRMGRAISPIRSSTISRKSFRRW